MENTTNAPFNFDAKFPTLEAAQLATKEADLANFKISKVSEGEWIVIDMKGKALPAPAAKPEGKAKAKTSKAKPAKAGRLSVEGRQAKAKAETPKPKTADFSQYRKTEGKWAPENGKLSARKWIGKWADFEAKAKEGKLPDAMGAKAERKDLFGGIFEAATHAPFEKRILALAALIRAKDEKGLKALQVKEISTTPIMLGKLRDLAIAALQAKAEKPAKTNGKRGDYGMKGGQPYGLVEGEKPQDAPTS